VFEKILNVCVLITLNWQIPYGQQEKMCRMLGQRQDRIIGFFMSFL